MYSHAQTYSQGYLIRLLGQSTINFENANYGVGLFKDVCFFILSLRISNRFFLRSEKFNINYYVVIFSFRDLLKFTIKILVGNSVWNRPVWDYHRALVLELPYIFISSVDMHSGSKNTLNYLWKRTRIRIQNGLNARNHCLRFSTPEVKILGIASLAICYWKGNNNASLLLKTNTF